MEAAFTLICEKGIKQTSITDITREAGVSVGTLYKYYPNKKEVFLAAYDMWNRNLFTHSFGVWQKFDSPFALREFIEASLDAAVQDHLFPKRAHDELMEFVYSDAEFRRIYNKCMLRSVDLALPCLAKLGLSVPNIREKLHLVINLMELYAHEVAYHDTEELDYSKIRESIIEAISTIMFR